MNFKTYQYLVRYSVFKPGALTLYRDAIKNQYLPEDELSELIWHKTKKLLDHSYKNVPWYNKKYSEIGLNPSDITKPEHFAQIPVLTRQEIIDNYSLFISGKINPESLKISTTGGSTGTPLKIGMQGKGIRELQKWQMYSWWDLTPGVNMASIYRGLPQKGLKNMATKLINWPQKVIRLDATHITKNKIEEFISRSKQIKPELIHGYVGAVDTIADYLIENKITLPAPKVVWLTAAPLTAVQKDKISHAFKAPVCDQYGCSEIYFIAAECQHKRGLHIFADAVKVEILNDENQSVSDGEYGKIILTNLNEYHFPLIRYENGDQGRLLDKKCSCGMTLPLMDKVKGRISDNLTLPDGTVLSGEYLTTIFDDYTNEVKQFQIVQKKDKSIQVNIVLKQPASKTVVIDSVDKELQKRIKFQVKLSIHIVDEINSTKGKLQFIVKE
ncbi:MAG: phenylacetate--CoA ligase family protein [Prolixibacteraceae bacterium]|nr:phenylacetate--CoA ligase family protein [Prolixibacteraceae bacterium]